MCYSTSALHWGTPDLHARSNTYWLIACSSFYLDGLVDMLVVWVGVYVYLCVMYPPHGPYLEHVNWVLTVVWSVMMYGDFSRVHRQWSVCCVCISVCVYHPPFVNMHTPYSIKPPQRKTFFFSPYTSINALQFNQATQPICRNILIQHSQ